MPGVLIRMYSYVIRISFVWTRMSFVCHSYVLVCHPYVTLMWFYHEPQPDLKLVCNWLKGNYLQITYVTFSIMISSRPKVHQKADIDNETMGCLSIVR